MRISIPGISRSSPFKYLLTFFIATMASVAQATFINFDDIPYVPADPEFPQFYDTPLTDQYADKGLIVHDGYIGSYEWAAPETIVSEPSDLIGGNRLTLQFTGDLPTFVSMYVSSFLEDSIFLNAYNSSGLVASKRTQGIHAEWGSPENEEYTPKQLVTFNVDAGISSIVIENYYNSRVSAMIDDLTFTRSVSVPEPTPIILLILGILGLIARRVTK